MFFNDLHFVLLCFLSLKSSVCFAFIRSKVPSTNAACGAILIIYPREDKMALHPIRKRSFSMQIAADLLILKRVTFKKKLCRGDRAAIKSHSKRI